MSDTAFNLLKPLISHHRTPAVWFADENALNTALALQPPLEGLSVICNRYDIYHQFVAARFDCRFTDFTQGDIPNDSLKQVFYRISKEKPIAHHIINLAYRLLQVGGELVLCGEKNQGIKSYFDKAKKRFGSDATLEKHGTVYLTRLQKSPPPTVEPDIKLPGDRALDDLDYHRIRPIAEQNGIPIYSKPGIFGWNKIDQGSAFLIENLPRFLQRLSLHRSQTHNNNPPTSVLDLGCGYGYLMIAGIDAFVGDKSAFRFVATDNNAAALRAARYNFQHRQLPVDVVADDCGAGIDEHFDIIICNPPFHQGFGVDGGLTDKFLQNTRRLLSSDGAAVFVVNRFIALERKAKAYFPHIEILAENRSFKIVTLTSQ